MGRWTRPSPALGARTAPSRAAGARTGARTRRSISPTTLAAIVSGNHGNLRRAVGNRFDPKGGGGTLPPSGKWLRRGEARRGAARRHINELLDTPWRSARR